MDPAEIKQLKDEVRKVIEAHLCAIVALAILNQVEEIPLKQIEMVSKLPDSNRLINVEKTMQNKRIKEIVKNLNQVFIGGVYELIKARLGREEVEKLYKRPEFEFFRHCRNASFHNNQFTFACSRGKEYPPKNASWREMKITKEDAGQKLFYDKLEDADTLLLVEDVLSLI